MLEHLVLSAALFEATPVLEALKSKGVNFEYIEIGVGPVHAAISTAKILEKAKGKRVTVIGSVGTFGEFEKPYLFQVDKVWWLPAGERLGHAKYMSHFYPPIELPKTGHFDLPYRQVITSTSVSFVAGFVDTLTDFTEPSNFVENMEAYGVVKNLLGVCESIDFVMGVSNAIGPDGSTQWQQNWKGVAALTADFVTENF